MNQTHIHLIITHLPIVGSILGAIVLIYGILTKSDETKVASYYLFIISSFGATIAFLTGESAEESVENLPGVVESVIKLHKESASISLVSLILLGVAALVGMFTITKINWSKNIALTVLIISLISFYFVSRTGYLGGKIRHTELNGVSENSSQGEIIKDKY